MIDTKKHKLLPCRELTEVLLPAYKPCESFGTICRTMRWEPKKGYVPRGFCGAIGRVDQVELVLITAEPGDPHPNESHPAYSKPDDLFARTAQYSYQCFETGKDLFHRNVRYIMNMCWPNLTFEEQMRRTWITESVLCSAPKEGGSVSSVVSNQCENRYLEKQLGFFDRPVIVALGSKARDRTKGSIYSIMSVGAASPPGCNRQGVRASWSAIADTVKKR